MPFNPDDKSTFRLLPVDNFHSPPRPDQLSGPHNHLYTRIRGAGGPFPGGVIDRIWNLNIYCHLGLRIHGFLFKISDDVELNHGDKSTFTKIFQ
jgi:hypothetical protein